MADRLKALIEALPRAQRATAKGAELAKVGPIARTAVGDHQLELVALKPITGGIEVLARVWGPDGRQLGFGRDGQVDIERFRFFNPPTRVHEPTLDAGGIRGYREDPRDALLQAVLRAARKTGKRTDWIREGSVGNTTTTIYAEASDGVLRNYSNSASWSTMRGAASATSEQTAPVRCHNSRFGSDRYLDRFFICFAAPIGNTDTIDAADLDLVTADVSTGNRDACLVQHTQADPADLVLGDFGGAGTTEGASRATCPTGPGSAWGFTLNATGLTWIDKAGYTKLCLRGAKDLDNTDPAEENTFTHKASETAGTTEDPTLVITHTTPAAAAFLRPGKVW